GVGQDLDAGSAQGRMDLILIEAGLFLLQLADEPADGLELLARGHAVGRGLLDAGVDLAAEQADALHEELVEVAGEDGEELDALQQWQAPVAGLMEDAGVELEP